MLMMINFSFIIYGHVEQIGNSSNMIRMIDASLDRVDGVKNVEPIDKNSKPVVLDSYDICFDKVSFAYDKKMCFKMCRFLFLKIQQLQLSAHLEVENQQYVV